MRRWTSWWACFVVGGCWFGGCACGVLKAAAAAGATATEFWNAAGTPVEHLPSEIVMKAADMVDAALAGLDQGELVTIPSLPDVADWEAYENARHALMPNLSRSLPRILYHHPRKRRLISPLRGRMRTLRKRSPCPSLPDLIEARRLQSAPI